MSVATGLAKSIVVVNMDVHTALCQKPLRDLQLPVPTR
jgi:hypothetical protein